MSGPAGVPEDGAIPGQSLSGLLGEAKALGFLGPGPISAQLDHARAFARAVELAWAARSTGVTRTGRPPRRLIDLGSGGGVPGLVLAVLSPVMSVVLVEAHARRAAFLRRAVGALELGGRVTVEGVRAELLGRTPSRRGTFEIATARGFARPAVVTECAAPLLEAGGLLVVSEPPSDGGPREISDRWPAEPLEMFGMGRAKILEAGSTGSEGSRYSFAAVSQERLCPPRFPRRVGVPVKHPLF